MDNGFNYPYLNDTVFLKSVDEMIIKEQFVKITTLNIYEQPLKSIEGLVTTGSINIDGNSAVRRTCNLTMAFNNEQIDITKVSSMLSINKKIKLEVGIKNITNQYRDYDIIWFPLGIYVIINPSISHSTSGVSVSLQLRDKMCLLNGDVSGLLPAAVNFNEIEAYTGNSAKNGHVYVIEGEIDKDNKILVTTPNHVEQVDFEDDKYALILEAFNSSLSSSTIVQPTIYQIIQELVNHFGGEQLGKIIISGVPDRTKQIMQWQGNVPLYRCKDGDNEFFTIDEKYATSEILQQTYLAGENIGYVFTDFIYPGELIGDAGQSICDVLDKIKNTLGNYEYFYDVFGNFVFQEKQNYLNTTQAKVEMTNMSNEDYLIDMGKGKSVYTFDSGNIITSYSNSPQYSKIKNDFIVWGTRNDPQGNSFPIRYHLAIDDKPKTGNTYTCLKYIDEADGIEKYIVPVFLHHLSLLPEIGLEGVYYRVEFEDEKELKPISPDIFYLYNSELEGYVQIIFDSIKQDITTTDWRTELYFSGQEAAPFGLESNYYYAELANEWPKLYDIGAGDFREEAKTKSSDVDFFLDFIDSDAAIGEFRVANIGRRQKVVTDDSVNCMFEPYIPDLVIIESGQLDTDSKIQECQNQAQAYTQVSSNIFKSLTIGKNYNSAYNMVRDLLYEYTSYNESIAISTLPIYYLEPNVRITVQDSKSGIYGDYVINSISLPLGIGATMNIACTRALQKM